MSNLEEVLSQVIDSANSSVVIVENKKAIVDGVETDSITPPSKEDIMGLWNQYTNNNGVVDLGCIQMKLNNESPLTIIIDIE